MITVTLGTIPYPFDRAIAWIQDLLESEIITEPIFIQNGVTDVSQVSQYPLVKTKSIIEYGQLIHIVNNSRLVISHAGQGSTRMLAAQQASFILLPRLASYKEHIDDHQLFFAQTMQQFGIGHCLNLEDLTHIILSPPPPFKSELFEGPRLSEHLKRRYPRESQISSVEESEKVT